MEADFISQLWDKFVFFSQLENLLLTLAIADAYHNI